MKADITRYGVNDIFSGACRLRRAAFFVFPALVLFFSFPPSPCALDVFVIKSSNIKPYQEALEGFKRTCGCTITEETISQARSHADILLEIREHKPDALLSIGIDALRIARGIEGIPVYSVMAPLHGLPESRNIAGVDIIISPAFQLSAMLDLFPDARKIGVLGTAGALEAHAVNVPEHARNQGVEIIAKRVSRSGDVPSLLNEMKGKIDLLWMIPDVKVVNEETVRAIMLFSFHYKVPAFTFSKKYVEMGAIATLHVAPHDMGEQAGELARNGRYEKKGGPPPRMEARKPGLIINKKIARKMGLKVNEDLFRRAPDVE